MNKIIKSLNILIVGIIFIINMFIVAGAGVIIEDGKINISNDLLVDTDVLVVDSTNNKVGIGVGTPSYLLHLRSLGLSTDILRIDASDGSRISRITETGGGYGWFEVDDKYGNPKFLVRGDGGNNYLLNANFGIGTSSPSAKLEIENEDSDADLYLDTWGASNYRSKIKFLHNGTSKFSIESDAANGYLSFFNSSNDEIMRLTSAGVLSAKSYVDFTPAVSNDYDAISDIMKIKSNNLEIDHNTLPDLARGEDVTLPITELKLVANYEEVCPENEKDMENCEIQEVEKLEWVQVGTETKHTRDIGGMVTINVRAIQQLLEKIEFLEQRVAELEKI